MAKPRLALVMLSEFRSNCCDKSHTPKTVSQRLDAACTQRHCNGAALRLSWRPRPLAASYK